METSAQRNTSTERQPVHYCSDIPGMEDATRWPLAGSALTSPPPRPPVWSRGAASGSCVKSRSTSWSSLSRAAISRSLASSWAARGGTGGHQEEEVGRVDACALIGMALGGKRKGGVLGRRLRARTQTRDLSFIYLILLPLASQLEPLPRQGGGDALPPALELGGGLGETRGRRRGGGKNTAPLALERILGVGRARA